MLRIIQAHFGATLQDLAKDLGGYEERYQTEVGKKLLIPNWDTTHKKDMEALCKEYNPSFIVIDQLSEVHGFHNDREDLRLGAAFRWARELAKVYDCPIIAVNQADASGEGKKYLDMGNVANSKTEIPAKADFILGIGKSNDQGFELIRHFNISKNKLMGDPDTDPRQKHGRFDVLIQPEIARYKDYD